MNHQRMFRCAQSPSLAAKLWALLAALAVASGCSNDTGASKSVADAKAQSDVSTGDLAATDAKVDAASALPGVPTNSHVDFMAPGQLKMTPEQRAVALQKLKEGGEFVDVHVRPEVVAIAGKQAEQAQVAPDQLTFPKAGNEALLALKAGTPLVGAPSTADNSRPFGFLRKVKAVKEVAGQIVIETEKAKLQDILNGAMSLKMPADDLQLLDTSGVDEGLYFPTWKGEYVPQGLRATPRRRWGQFRAPLKDLDADIKLTSDWGASASYKAMSLETSKTFGNVKLSLSGDMDIKADFSFKPTFFLQVGVDGLDFEYLNFGASGQLDLAAAIDLNLLMALTVSSDNPDAGNATSSLASDPIKPDKKDLELLELGPYAGPWIPTQPPIPTCFKIDFVADCSLTVFGNVHSHLEGGVSTGAGFGVSWEEGDACSSDSDCWTTCNSGKCGPGGSGWKLTSSSNFSYWKNVTLELGGGVIAECGIQPQIEWLIGDIAGPMAGLRGAVRGTLEANSICPVPDTISANQRPNLDVGLKFDVGASVLLGGKIDLWITEFDFEFTVYEYWWTLWQNTWSWAQQGFGWCMASCIDKAKDYSESDVDCGGSCATKCAQGKLCNQAGDCETYNCDGGKCGPFLCADKVKDGYETDVDCGGVCPYKCAVGKKCAQHSDCATDSSGVAMGCYPYTYGDPKSQTCQIPTCSDGWQGPAEQVGIDCGGTCSCQPKAACTLDSDCGTGKACANKGCINSADKTCYLALNSKKDSDETDVDCGGSCAGKLTDPSICTSPNVCAGKLFFCADNQACKLNADCSSGYCNAGKCAQHCADAKLDGDETDADCGGKACAPCAQSKKCLVNSDCGSGLFCSPLSLTCVPSTCTSGKKDGDETDSDCGGSCPTRCATGKGCAVGFDCDSKICSIGKLCVASLCENGVVDRILPDPVKYPKEQYFNNTPGYEYSVDCGLTCPDCADGKPCYTADNPLWIGNAGCAGGYCKPDYAGAPTGKCATVSCKDGLKNGNEADIDCGGTSTCPGCGEGKACVSLLDPSLGPGTGCAAGLLCNNNKCQKDGIGNGVKDQYESDVDCGGYATWNPTRCANGKACSAGSDCAGGLCSGGVCIAATCPNGVQDGSESDVDCGSAKDKCGTGAGASKSCGTCNTPCATGKKCSADNQCSSGYCHINGLCAANHCVDGKKDATESFADCGGSDCPACNLATGAACVKNEDCASNVCEQASSGSPMICGASCKDGAQNGSESDVDCGTTDCGKCAVGKFCVSDANCLSGACSANGFCVTSKCYNGKLDSSYGSTEVSKDCGGGACPGCAIGVYCKVGTDCVTGVCTANKCAVAASCSNGVQDSSETAVDCGSTCNKCTTGKACKINADCGTGNCESTLCYNSKTQKSDLPCLICKTAVGGCYSNGLVDGNETDVDCGASCTAKCALSKKCASNLDCQSGICDQTTVPPRCSVDACKDAVKSTSTSEGDVDCGGSCTAKCASGKTCALNSDCASSICSTGSKPKCVDTTCSDGKLSGDETDLDCGGSCSSKCTTGKGCLTATDCATSKTAPTAYCSAAAKCVTSACSDGYLTSGEVDIDCGGVCANKCPLGKKCAAASDCTTGFCDGTVCVASACEDKLKQASETDVDCGGTCATKCGTGKTCVGGADCASGDCGTDKKCQSSLCSNGQKDGDETGTDCGGSCTTKCSAGGGCASAGDCASAHCAVVSKVCVDSACADEALSPGESDVDCGTACNIGCSVGSACSAAGDCASAACSVGGKCVTDTCQDGKLGTGETDVDCGGSCASKCATSKLCKVAGDCQSGACSIAGQCVASLCLDGKLDGGETGIDCGGGCPGKCKSGDPCGGNGDCQSSICAVTNLCVATTCQDGIVSGTESDVDCGGGCTQKCGASAKCKVEGDCASGACSTAGLCVASKCLDGQKNGDESDVDCGGSCSAACGLNLACKLGTDCASGVCSVGGKCAASTCTDGKLSGSETGVDCGGSCATKCSVGVACSVGGDCQTAQCSVGKLCVATACENGVKDGSETGVDCGGACGKCASGLGCSVNADCQSAVCALVSKLCVADTCKDEQKSGSESDVDCGGMCAQKCVGGKGCAVNADCASAQCGAGNVCAGSVCDNGKLDAGESDIDCGGSCPACSVGKACSVGGNCASGVCSTSKLCVASTCEDGLKTSGEGDVDCGGACATKCALTKGCASGTDCSSGVCSATKQCVASTCVDGIKSGSETDLDCGGTCSTKCALSKACKVGGDCSTGACGALSLVCVASTCLDQSLTTGETDIDCGGTCSAKCLSGKKCKVTGDCAAGVCNALGVCAADYCSDGQKNGSESDVDCGGTCSQKCATDKLCSVGGDCSTTVCSVGGKCVASLCFDGAKDNGEGDIDCGGSCAAKCATGKTCTASGDCQTAFCSATTKLCTATSCHDGVLNGTETDVDCGGAACVACGNYLACKTSADCDSGLCGANGKCSLGCLAAGGTSTIPWSGTVWKFYDGAKVSATDNSKVMLTTATGNTLGKVFDSVDYLTGAPVTINFTAGTAQGSGGNLNTAQGIALSIVAAKDAAELNTYATASSGAGCMGYGVKGACGNGTVAIKALHIELDPKTNTTSPFTETVTGQHVAITLDGDPTVHYATGAPPVDLLTGTAQDYTVTISGSTVQVLVGTKILATATIPAWTFAGGYIGFSAASGGVSCAQQIQSLSIAQSTCAAVSKACTIGADCASGVCSAVSKLCVADTCSDQKISGKESDIDCGGTCATKCASSKLCYANTDCTSGACLGTGKCQ